MLSPEKQQELVNRFNEPESNYSLFREGVQGFLFDSKKPRDQRRDTEAILRMYTTFTDKLVGVADGSIEHRDIEDPLQPERSHQKPDVLLFLDKSARPVSWMVDAFWEQFAKEDAEKPDYEFLNIDRTNWFMRQGHVRQIAERYLGPSDFDIDKVSDEDIARIRAVFVDGDLSEDGWQEQVWNLGTRLDGKNIVVVDEVKNKGGTLSIATQLLRRAVPEAVVSGVYFWETDIRIINDRTGETQADSVPVWYDAVNPMGRGIGDISKAYYEHLYAQEPSQENLRKKIGWSVLSAPHFNVDTYEPVDDKKADTVKQDIAYLSYAVADGRILRVPSPRRTTEERIAIFERQGLAPREATEWTAGAREIKRRYANRAVTPTTQV